MIVNFCLINAGVLASSAHAQAALDQLARRKDIFGYCNIRFLNVKAQKPFSNSKNASSRIVILNLFLTVYVNSQFLIIHLKFTQ